MTGQRTNFAVVQPEQRAARESSGQRLFRTLSERWPVVVIAVLAAVAAALVYVSAAQTTYKAQADLLISPESDPNLNILPLFRSSSDPTRDTQTAALLVDTAQTAQRATRLLSSTESSQAILDRVQVVPVAGSDVVAVTASAPTPEGAARLAKAFALGAIDVLGARLQSELRIVIPRLRAQVGHSAQNGQAGGVDSLSSQLGALQALIGAPDPTIQLENPAHAPTRASSPRRALSLGASILLGLVVGVAIALGLDAIDPRLRRESQLADVLDLPILARLPWVPDDAGRESAAGLIEPRSLLRAHEFLLEAVRGFDEGWAGRKRTLVFTPADRGRRCTAIAVEHSCLVASWGERVILLDGDTREPAVARATGARPSDGSEGVVLDGDPVHGALIPVEVRGVEMRVLAIQPPEPGVGLHPPRGHDLVAGLLREADVLIIDAPRLTDSAQALLLARSANGVVVVARLGETRLDELRELGDLLASHAVPSAGVVLVGKAARPLRRGASRGRALATDAIPTSAPGSPSAADAGARQRAPTR
jgi:Mrp family chromosome partitioning ATPase/capsular polysaccharide biosynthesis protein